MLISKKEAEAAVLTLLKYITHENNAEVLQNTPRRVIESFAQIFSGYNADIEKEIGKNFDNNFNYNNIILVDNITLFSTCEHHLLPIYGVAHVAYIPDKKLLGLSKVCRIVDIFARRLQLQERLTFQIAETIQNILFPKGVAVCIVAMHDCMSIRGAMKAQSQTKTMHFTQLFARDSDAQDKFLKMIEGK